LIQHHRPRVSSEMGSVACEPSNVTLEGDRRLRRSRSEIRNGIELISRSTARGRLHQAQCESLDRELSKARRGRLHCIRLGTSFDPSLAVAHALPSEQHRRTCVARQTRLSHTRRSASGARAHASLSGQHPRTCVDQQAAPSDTRRSASSTLAHASLSRQHPRTCFGQQAARSHTRCSASMIVA
jgi:hypothetical protein